MSQSRGTAGESKPAQQDQQHLNADQFIVHFQLKFNMFCQGEGIVTVEEITQVVERALQEYSVALKAYTAKKDTVNKKIIEENIKWTRDMQQTWNLLLMYRNFELKRIVEDGPLIGSTTLMLLAGLKESKEEKSADSNGSRISAGVVNFLTTDADNLAKYSIVHPRRIREPANYGWNAFTLAAAAQNVAFFHGVSRSFEKGIITSETAKFFADMENARGEYIGSTPLMFAAYEGCDEIVKILFALKADWSRELTGARAPYAGYTALHYAIDEGHLGTLRLLIELILRKENAIPGVDLKKYMQKVHGHALEYGTPQMMEITRVALMRIDRINERSAQHQAALAAKREKTAASEGEVKASGSQALESALQLDVSAPEEKSKEGKDSKSELPSLSLSEASSSARPESCRNKRRREADAEPSAQQYTNPIAEMTSIVARLLQDAITEKDFGQIQTMVKVISNHVDTAKQQSRFLSVYSGNASSLFAAAPSPSPLSAVSLAAGSSMVSAFSTPSIAMLQAADDAAPPVNSRGPALAR